LIACNFGTIKKELPWVIQLLIECNHHSWWGNTWRKVPSNKLPKVMDGEAALRQAILIF
jgi:hypothetical protein